MFISAGAPRASPNIFVQADQGCEPHRYLLDDSADHHLSPVRMTRILFGRSVSAKEKILFSHRARHGYTFASSTVSPLKEGRIASLILQAIMSPSSGQQRERNWPRA